MPRPRIDRRLSELLEERLITHRELASALGVHEQNVSRWVRGVNGPEKRRLREIAEYFEIEPRSLVNDDDEPVPA